MTTLTGQQIADEGLVGWAYFYNSLETRIATPDFAAGLALVAAIGAAAELADHHPDLNLRYTHVDVRLTSHDEQGVTIRDVRAGPHDHRNGRGRRPAPRERPGLPA